MHNYAHIYSPKTDFALLRKNVTHIVCTHNDFIPYKNLIIHENNKKSTTSLKRKLVRLEFHCKIYRIKINIKV